MAIKYRGFEYKKNQSVKFVIPTDYRIINPEDKNIIWRYGKIKYFSNDKKSCYLNENGIKEVVRISLFCVLPLN
tara:strand:+ start:2063 stop:2284 length:222 start_codon:yes stop_codon:yes gene_type:complete